MWEMLIVFMLRGTVVISSHAFILPDNPMVSTHIHTQTYTHRHTHRHTHIYTYKAQQYVCQSALNSNCTKTLQKDV